MMGDDSIRAAPARMEPSASPMGVRVQARTESRAGPSRRASSGDAATSAVETRSARMRRTRHVPSARARSIWTTDTLAPNGRGWTKCTPASTESRSSRWEWPTTTRSGRVVSEASDAATFSPPMPVVS